MSIAAPRTIKNTTVIPRLYLAFELSLEKWNLAFGVEQGGKIRMRHVLAGDRKGLLNEIQQARRFFRLPVSTTVASCYEAGREAFWLHRYLISEEIENVIVDAASIETNRRAKKAKTDRIDARKLLSLLIRHHIGDPAWSVVNVPSVQDEDDRHLHRQLRALRQERTRHTNRIKGLLMNQGTRADRLPADWEPWLERLRTWDDEPLPPGIHRRIANEFSRRAFIHRQILDLELEQRRYLRESQSKPAQQMRTLTELCGIGEQSAWLFVMEFFAWRDFQNAKQVGALAGFAPVPHQSGNENRDRGISHAGNRHVRAIAVEIAWMWLHHQPDSDITLWYNRRFARGGPRLRKIGIVAVARKLLIALWRYVEFDIVPEGVWLKA